MVGARGPEVTFPSCSCGVGGIKLTQNKIRLSVAICGSISLRDANLSPHDLTKWLAERIFHVAKGVAKNLVFSIHQGLMLEKIKQGIFLFISPPLEIRGEDMGDVMVLVESEEELEEEEDAAEEEEEVEEEANERAELPKEIPTHGHIHRVTALVNGNVDWMDNGLQALQGELLP